MEPDARPAEAPSTVEATAPTIAAATADETDKQFWLALSHGQVQDLMRQEAANRGGGQGLFGVLLALNGVGERMDVDELTHDQRYQDRRISQSVIRSLLVLSAFASGEAYGVNSLAEELHISATTTWRYLKTWVALGVLEERKDRRYQLARRWMGELSQIAPGGRPDEHNEPKIETSRHNHDF
jgi:AraC-like DNA-binding protein